MQVSSKLLLRTAIVMLGLLLACSVLVALSSVQKADALSASDWSTVKTAIDSYISGQFVADAEGEAGFVIDAAQVKARIDNNVTGGDNTYLGENDNAANAPVLVDVYFAATNVIPGSSARCLWNGTTTTGCLETANVDVIKARVNAHEAAGFSTDVVAYCVTGHTEAPATGGLGIIANAGGLGGSTAPNVYAFKWGRNGWTNTPKVYSNANTKGSPTATSSYASASNAMTECDGKTGAELVRCTAAWAIRGTGGFVNNGVTTWAATAGQAIDIRTGDLTGKTIVNGTAGSNTVQIPIDTLFNTGLNKLNPSATPKKLFVSRTQHVAGIAAIGAEMLGYDSAFLQWGMPNYNNTLDEKQLTNTHPTYATIAATANSATSGVDVTAPSVSSVDVTSVGTDNASIHRAANEPATMKVEYGTAPGVYTELLNNTVLNAHKTVSLTGLTPATTYYFKVTSYDGQANGTASAEQSFTTSAPADTEAPVLSLPADITVAADNPSGTTVSYTATATDNVDGPVPVSCDPVSDSLFAVGTTAVDCSATDAAGNSASDSFSVTVTYCETGTPSLGVGPATAFWSSYAEFTNRNLSVTYPINNSGSVGAYNVQITGSNATMGVTLTTSLPATVGDIAAGGSSSTTLVYHVPVGVGSFRTTNSASAADGCGNITTYGSPTP